MLSKPRRLSETDRSYRVREGMLVKGVYDENNMGDYLDVTFSSDRSDPSLFTLHSEPYGEIICLVELEIIGVDVQKDRIVKSDS